MAALEQAHRSPTVLELPNAGVPTYSGLVLVVRVGEAHYQGAAAAGVPAVAHARRHGGRDGPRRRRRRRSRTIDPRLDSAFERAALAALAPLVPPAGASQPFGYQNPYAWRAFGVWMHQHGLLRNANAGGLAITDEFLPGQGE